MGRHSKDSIIEGIVTGTHYDINELKPIYAAYKSANLDEGGTSWALQQAIGKRLVEHARSEEIIEEDECEQAGGKQLLEHADSKDDLIEVEECKQVVTEHDITNKLKTGQFGWFIIPPPPPSFSGQ